MGLSFTRCMVGFERVGLGSCRGVCCNIDVVGNLGLRFGWCTLTVGFRWGLVELGVGGFLGVFLGLLSLWVPCRMFA